jgi:hypothetical protein
LVPTHEFALVLFQLNAILPPSGTKAKSDTIDAVTGATTVTVTLAVPVAFPLPVHSAV